MATKRPKPPRRPPRPPRPEAAAPPWLTQLRDEVFADPGFPEVEPTFRLPTGQPAVRQRAIEYHGGRLYYTETWRAVHSLEALHVWRHELDMPSFLSATPVVRTHAVATLRA